MTEQADFLWPPLNNIPSLQKPKSDQFLQAGQGKEQVEGLERKGKEKKKKEKTSYLHAIKCEHCDFPIARVA